MSVAAVRWSSLRTKVESHINKLVTVHQVHYYFNDFSSYHVFYFNIVFVILSFGWNANVTVIANFVILNSNVSYLQ